MILVLGIDAYPYDWADQLREADFHARPLFSPHAQSPPAWNSLMSGLTAETHGFQGLPIKGVRDRGHGRLRYVWDHLNAAGQTTVCVGVPFIFPPMFMSLHVCGYPAEPRNYTFPKRAMQDWPFEYRDLVAWHRGKDPHEFHTVPDAELMKQAKESRWKQAHRFLLAISELRPELAILCLTDLDRLSHAAYRSMQHKKLRGEVVADLLALAQKLRAGCCPDWMFVVSDHGLDLTLEPPTMEGDDYWRQTHGMDMPATQRGIFGYWSGGGAAETEGDVQLEDLVPTLLYLLDAPPASAIEGRALTEIMASEAVNENETKQQLAQLGYL